jgi:hypothetical protein
MQEILDRIDKLEKTKLNGPKNEKVDELYGAPLAAGLACFALSLLGGETVWLKLSA